MAKQTLLGNSLDLLALGNVHGLEEGVHVLPAVELTKTSNVRLRDRLESVTGAVTVDKLLDVGRLNLAAVVEDLTSRGDQDLSQVEGSVVNLRETHRDVAVCN